MKKPARVEKIASVLQVLEGKIVDVASKHDASRYTFLFYMRLWHDFYRDIQICLKFGDPEQIAKIHQEVKGNIVDLAKDNHATHVIQKLLKCVNISIC